jgi:hypothetical protein
MGAGNRAEQPGDGDERSILTGWLAFHRDALAVKCHGLTDDQLVEWIAPVSPETQVVGTATLSARAVV